ncbi:uncharacterized protein LOC131686936 [Topomyia yanbarensis]|uniref:uncharacterized protein LOC131686936 n=1 Tax=Topomyia yanbarensis TaxID=2498891 RepID=UPI00273BE290|nr:uncharacterized protein LOC131686936 [Topomyia yanbarensis]
MWSQATPVAIVLVLLIVATSGTEREEDPPLQPSTPRRGRFLGLLGLLTGLTLGDSLDDSDHPRIGAPSGIVKINIGRPLAESFYHYMYNPYYYGSVPSINIKIPLRPESGHEGYGVVDFGVGASSGAFGGQVGQLGPHGGNQFIEPRPILSDVLESTETTIAEETPKKPKKVLSIRSSKLPYSRIIRSTIRSDITEDEQIASVVSVDKFEQTSPTTTNLAVEDTLELESTTTATTEQPLILHATAIPIIEDNSITTQASEPPSFPVPQSYIVHDGSLPDPSIISITTAEPELSFKPSRPDKLQDSCINRDEFRPVVKI